MTNDMDSCEQWQTTPGSHDDCDNVGDGDDADAGGGYEAQHGYDIT